MPITINGTGTVTGISAGGLPDACITTADLADGAATPAKTTGGPAFSAYQSSAQTISAGTTTKIQLQTEEFDTANCFDSTTNYRFTPNVAGYYQVSFAVRTDAGTISALHAAVFKNGAGAKSAQFTNTALAAFMGSASALIFLNGTTDYIELHTYSGHSVALLASAAGTYFQAVLVRPA
jgi:hypothetical protein